MPISITRGYVDWNRASALWSILCTSQHPNRLTHEPTRNACPVYDTVGSTIVELGTVLGVVLVGNDVIMIELVLA